MTKKFRSVALAIIAGVLLLSGCAVPPTGSVAFRAGDQTIGTREVESTLDVFANHPELKVSPTTVASVYALAVVLDQVAVDKGLTIKESDISAATGQDSTLATVRQTDAGKAFERRLVRAQLIYKQLTDPKVLTTYSVDVNPRYGEWDQTQLAMALNTSLSQASQG